jgi:hypothetical protein
MLILGQFGLIGLGLVGVALGVPLLSMFLGQKRAKGTRQTYRLVMLMAMMGIADALLNAFIFLPAIPLVAMLAAGGRGRAETRGRSRSGQSLAAETREKRISPVG